MIETLQSVCKLQFNTAHGLFPCDILTVEMSRAISLAHKLILADDENLKSFYNQGFCKLFDSIH